VVTERDKNDGRRVKVESGPVNRFIPPTTTFLSERHKEETKRKKEDQERAHKELMARIGSPQANVMGPVKTASQTPEDHTLLSNRNNPVYHGKEVLKNTGGAAPERTTHHPLTVGYGGEQNRRKKVGTGMGFKDDNHVGDRGGLTVYPPDNPHDVKQQPTSSTGGNGEGYQSNRRDAAPYVHNSRPQEAFSDHSSGRGRDAVKPAWMLASDGGDRGPAVEIRQNDTKTSGDKSGQFDDPERREGSTAGVNDKADGCTTPPAPHTPFRSSTAQYTQSSAAPALDGNRQGDQCARGMGVGMGRGRTATHPAWMTEAAREEQDNSHRR
jgi:hypothetical protein